MKLTQPELIQVFRKRSQMNQGTFGSKAFDTSYESGRTKVKNIELGKQKPTEKDLKKMARVLGISPRDLVPESEIGEGGGHPRPEGLYISRQTLAYFPGLDVYLDMIDKAVRIDDKELISYISGKISVLFQSGTGADAVNL
jgi:transcriptional regulator with XRE-family HTH domain